MKQFRNTTQEIKKGTLLITVSHPLNLNQPQIKTYQLTGVKAINTIKEMTVCMTVYDQCTVSVTSEISKKRKNITRTSGYLQGSAWDNLIRKNVRQQQQSTIDIAYAWFLLQRYSIRAFARSHAILIKEKCCQVFVSLRNKTRYTSSHQMNWLYLMYLMRHASRFRLLCLWFNCWSLNSFSLSHPLYLVSM